MHRIDAAVNADDARRRSGGERLAHVAVAHALRIEREDPVLEQIQRGVSFAQHHARWLIAGALVVIAVVIGTIALQRSRVRGDREAGQYLIESQAGYLQGNYAAAETQLKEMLQSYGRSKLAGPAQLTLGDVLLAQGRPEEALKAYQAAAGKAGGDVELAAAAQRGQGAAMEDAGRVADASQAYEQAASHPSLSQVPDLIAAARTALQAGDPARAKTLLERAKQADKQFQNQTEISTYQARVDAAQPK
jgi:tetratricopeptide (TPR) repeat protein